MKSFSVFGIYIDIYRKKSDIQNKIDILSNLATDLSYRTYKETLLPLVKKYDLQKTKNHTPQNIMTVNTCMTQGGAAKIAYTLAYKNIHKGLQSSFVSSGQEKITEKNYIHHIPLNTREKQQEGDILNSKTGYLDFFFFQSLQLKNLEAFKSSDILHLHNLHGGYFSLFALPELTALKPTVWTLHDTCSFTGHCGNFLNCNKWEHEKCMQCPFVSLYQALPFDNANFIFENKKQIYKNLAKDTTIVTPSQWLADKVKKSILKDYTVKLIPNGIDTRIFKPYDKNNARETLNLPQNKKILLFACEGGDKSPWKGGEFIQPVYDYFNKNEDIFFIVIGGAKREKIANNYLKLPYVYDESLLATYYSAADLFIYPSKADNHPLVVIESLACELPVITFNTGGIPEIVNHMRTGYVAEHQNLDDFMKGINIFLSDDILRKNAGILGRKTVEEKFTIDLMVLKYLDLYNEVHEKRKKLKKSACD